MSDLHHNPTIKTESSPPPSSQLSPSPPALVPIIEEEWKHPIGGGRYVTVKIYENVVLVHIRRFFFSTQEDRLIPTKDGIAINHTQFAQLAAVFSEVEVEVAKRLRRLEEGHGEQPLSNHTKRDAPKDSGEEGSGDNDGAVKRRKICI